MGEKMNGLSKHTLLMNKMIGLTKSIYDWPAPLKELGYKVELIEPKFLDENREIINPDLLFSSNKLLHALISECKSGKNLNDKDKKQIQKYIQIKPKIITPRVSVYDPARLTIDVCYAINEDNKEIIDEIEKYHKFPIIVFSNIAISKKNYFKCKKLNNKFSTPIDISNKKPPTYFYPFSDEDDDSTIALWIFQEILSMTLKNIYKDELEIEIEKLLNNIHPLWRRIEKHKKAAIKSKVNRIIWMLKQKHLGEYLQKIKGKQTWKITKSLQAFAKECEKIVEELKTQRTLSGFSKE